MGLGLTTKHLQRQTIKNRKVNSNNCKRQKRKYEEGPLSCFVIVHKLYDSSSTQKIEATRASSIKSVEKYNPWKFTNYFYPSRQGEFYKRGTGIETGAYYVDKNVKVRCFIAIRHVRPYLAPEALIEGLNVKPESKILVVSDGESGEVKGAEESSKNLDEAKASENKTAEPNYRSVFLAASAFVLNGVLIWLGFWKIAKK